MAENLAKKLLVKMKITKKGFFFVLPEQGESGTEFTNHQDVNVRQAV